MEETKRQYLPAPQGLAPGLWVVATPIGNLQDFTPRARLALEHASAILCEDTRRTARLTAALAISKRLERLDAHAGPARIAELVERLSSGENLAMVTDAGTPGISDPAAALVAAARAAGVTISPVPGASAVTALLSVAGFGDTAFTFCGFFPRKAGERKAELDKARLCAISRLFVWFESPERIVESLAFLAGEEPRARVVAGKELTKLHERIFAGTAEDISISVKEEISREGAVGEWCFALELDSRSADAETADKSSEWVKALHCLLDVSISAPEAARRVSHYFGAPKREVYETALRILGKK